MNASVSEDVPASNAARSPARTLCTGDPLPLGATWDGEGTNFSLFSEIADRVQLCLFDDDGRESAIDLPDRTAYCWHGYVRGVMPGQRYGFRVHGPWRPAAGDRCNPAKLLVDPYARAICGNIGADPAVFPYPLGGDEMQRDERDSAPHMPRSIVIDDHFDWDGDAPLRRPLQDTIVYELHVKGFTQRHPAIPPDIRGTYAGLAHPAAIDYLRRLGVTAVELLPVHQFAHDQHLIDKGLVNYWGYNSYGYFAPHNGYAAGGDRGDQVREFKQMVQALHSAGLEVILDVVYNHTAEGNHCGPLLSLKGIDNRVYYRTVGDSPQFYMDYTGTGNSLNMRHPHALMLVMDSLRYWVQEMHVDGFRFDLASTLARERHDVDRLSAFFDIIHQDPTLSRVKLIAEPWDVGEGGYQVGNFPVRWCEWNGRYRDTVRDYWRGEPGGLAEFASRFAGSSDLYEDDGRKPYASVNFVTAHDGFTLRDLASYNDKHNEANGEGNRDGDHHNRAWNCGAEGPTDDPDILALRNRQQRNFLVTLFLSQGIPMLVGGDEAGRTQGGNNNAYCQDNETTWVDWNGLDAPLLAFTRRLIELRSSHTVFRRRRWLTGTPVQPNGLADIAWFKADGRRMTDEDWHQHDIKALIVFLNGRGLRDRDEDCQPLVDDSFVLLLNGGHDAVTVTMPEAAFGEAWIPVIDTSSSDSPEGPSRAASESFELAAHTVLVCVAQAMPQ
jgi:glycogen operon protein